MNSCIWKSLVGFLVVAPFAGCAATRPTQSEQVPALELSSSSEGAKELPANHAAKVCVAAGAEFAKKGYNDEAIQQFEKAREHDPKLPDIAKRLAVLYHRQGDLSHANTEFKRALDENPKDSDLLNDMGYYCYDRGDWAGAETWFKKALSVNPKHQRAWINLGMACAQQAKTKESYEAFVKVVSPAEAHANVGMILAQTGQIEGAKIAMRQSLNLEPDSKMTNAALAQLEKYQPSLDAQKSPPHRLMAN